MSESPIAEPIASRDAAAFHAAPSSPHVLNEPARWRCLAVGAVMLAVNLAAMHLNAIRLPYDETFGSVLYLMWSANPAQSRVPEQMVVAMCLVALVVPLYLVAWGLVWPAGVPRARALARWCYRFALCWPLLLLLSTSLGRVVANVVYALAPWAAGDATPLLARLEGSMLARVQAALEHGWMGTLSAGVYSWVWIIGLMGFGPWLVLRGRDRAVSQIILATFLTAVLAVPFFLLIPVSDPWATNPLYGYGGPGQTVVRYLYPHADVAALTSIAMTARWATGSCLPSLHVAFPLVYALVARRHRLRVETWLLGSVAAATSIAVIYLGRHWILDVAAAVPYAFAIRWLVERIDPRLVLSWEQ